MTRLEQVTSVRYTAEQQRAIVTRGCSVALSAGAGCGKTFVLTERFLDYFSGPERVRLAPADLGTLVAITFTERAAREMRDRIRQKCAQRLRESDAADAEHWAALLRALDSARISTIHSFCAALLRSHAVEAGVDPQFEVLDQAQADALLVEVIDDHLRRLIAQRDAVTLDLAVRFDLGPLHDMIRALMLDCDDEDFSRWNQSTEISEQLNAWQDFHHTRVLPSVGRQLLASRWTEQILSALGDNVPTHATMIARRQRLLANFEALAHAAGSGRSLTKLLEEIHDDARVQHGGGAKAWPSEEAFAEFREAAEKLRGYLKKTLLSMAAAEPLAATEAATVGRQLMVVAAGAADAYSERKRELGALDFADLLRRARRLLTDPRHADLRRQLTAHLTLLLVDEFQDTDPLQVQLVSALCGGSIEPGKLFFVGDYKQSIYRFRGADPDVFRHLRDETPSEGRLSLTVNFRSQPAILHFVNALFWRALGDDYEALHAHRSQACPTPAIEFLWATDETAERKDKVRESRRREADWIARRLRALIDSRRPLVTDSATGAVRAAEPGDIAILFRALSDVDLYEDALRRHEIDYYLVGGRAFYAQQEVFDLLNLLRAVHSTTDVVSLAGVLRSAFFSLTDETIFWLAQHPEGLSAGLKADPYPSEIPPAEQRQARYAADTIAHLRQHKDRMMVCELIEEALDRTGYDATLLNEFLGERKLANLRKLIEQARQFERGGFLGLADFIVQLTEFVARQPDEALAATHSENTNVVRLMTVHQSKGLEFPIVVVADVDRPLNGGGKRVHFDARLGPLVRLSDDDVADPQIGGFELWNFVEREQELAESHRLLYVATTRAADYLMLSSGIAPSLSPSGAWTQLLARRFDLATGRFRGDLPSGESVPQILVTSSEPAVPSARRTRRSSVDWDTTIDALRSTVDGTESFPVVNAVAVDAGARRQFSFSRLTGAIHRRDESTEFLPGDVDAQADPRELGILAHAVLAAMDFASPTDVPKLVEWHAERLGSGEASSADALAMIGRFVASPRARKLGSAQVCHAELEFLLGWPPGDVASGGIILTGWIDRLYQDSDGRWHVLDFKTNRVSADVSAAAAPYEMQMLLYALASEQILGRAPASLVLHFLRTGAEHSFVWNDAARRVVELVDRGIAAAQVAPESPGVC